jgi:ATP-dependent DNA ligase
VEESSTASARLHRNHERVEIFSFDLKRITGQFPELADQARKFKADLIIDGEIMAFAEDRKLTVFDLQKRLGRKSEGADLFAGVSANVPVVFVIFDLLWRNGQSLLKTPLRDRREILRELDLPPQFQVADVSRAVGAEIEKIFQCTPPCQRRADGKRSGELLLARAARPILVQTKEGTRDPGRRGRRRRARARQA